jgi:hypothetical protein
MGTYGRNFEFRIPPEAQNRKGRFAVPTTGTPLPIGAPVQVDTAAAATDLDLQPLELVTGATARAGGHKGILVYEWGPAAFAGVDPFLTTYSDRDFAPLGAAVQLVNGPEVKVVFTNTAAQTFLNTRSYPGRIMVAGMGATPSLAVGDFLTPGTGDDTAGYWAETATEADAWLVVDHVDVGRQEVEATFLF